MLRSDMLALFHLHGMKPLHGLSQKRLMCLQSIRGKKVTWGSDVITMCFTDIFHIICWDGAWLSRVLSGDWKSASFPSFGKAASCALL